MYKFTIVYGDFFSRGSNVNQITKFKYVKSKKQFPSWNELAAIAELDAACFWFVFRDWSVEYLTLNDKI